MNTHSMKLWMGSAPAMFLQVSRPVGQPEAGLASAGVSATPSPPVADVEQPPWKVWYCIAARKNKIMTEIKM